MRALADTSVLVPLVAGDHQHHESAVRWLNGQPRASVVICRIAQLGFLRLLCNQSVMGKAVQTPANAYGVYEAVLRDDRFLLDLSEPLGIDASLEKFIQERIASKGLWTDAYLASYALCAQLTLVTFDRGFSAYRGPSTEILS